MHGPKSGAGRFARAVSRPPRPRPASDGQGVPQLRGGSRWSTESRCFRAPAAVAGAGVGAGGRRAHTVDCPATGFAPGPHRGAAPGPRQGYGPWTHCVRFVNDRNVRHTTLAGPSRTGGAADSGLARFGAHATAAKTLRTFNRYQIIDHPPLRDGERFAIATTAPRYRLARRPSTGYGPESPMHNPLGLWRLEPV